jgi:hypothetical protein
VFYKKIGNKMNNESYVYQNIKISDMFLNPENPRFDPVKHQTEAIKSMLEDQKNKLITLAKHIIEFGVNPTDITIIKPFNEKWLVLEGNRRVTVLKLLHNPELIPNEYRRIKTEFKKLCAKIEKSRIETVFCVIVSNEKMSNEWIRLKHTGQNDGAGIVNWDSQQTGRFNSRLKGETDVYICFLDYLKVTEGIPVDYKNNLHKIKKTNLSRSISDPDIRKLAGIVYENGAYSLGHINDYLLGLLYDLIFNELSVSAIYSKSDRLQYIENLKNRVDKIKNYPQVQPVNNHENNQGAADTNFYSRTSIPSTASSTGKQRRSYPVNRSTLVPSIHHLVISNARIQRIFNELKSLDINRYPNAVSVLFRVFIELSCDCYISTGFLNTVSPDSRLSQKIEAVASDIESKSIMTKNELRAARQMSSSPTQNSSIKTFHAYVHNKDVTPIPDDLKTAWDDLWPFIEKIWA